MFVARFLVTTECVGGECDTRWLIWAWLQKIKVWFTPYIRLMSS